MKKMTIRGRIFWIFFSAMVMAVFITFLIVRMVSASVMKYTLSDYLMSAVDVNADKLIYQTDEEAQEAEKIDTDDLFLQYGDGVLRIDDDFLNMLNDVESALYQEDGTLLYGANEHAKEMEEFSFTTSRLYEATIEGERHIIYDRKVTARGLEGLWIRGMVPLTQQENQVAQITKSMLAFLPLLLVIIFFGSLLASGGIVKPISQMEKTAKEIVDGSDLEKRIEMGSHKDELFSLATSYNEMFDRLNQSFERERQFTSDASHELRTPLAVILNQTEYVLDNDCTKEEVDDALHVIERSAKRMKALVQDLLSLARMGQGKRRYPFEKENVSEICELICEDMSRIGYKNIRLESHIQKNICFSCNRSLIERLLINLIDNAYKYGKEDGHIWVFLETLDEKEKKCVLSVKDDGMGISDCEKERVFERFYRIDSSRGNEKGYGLGLSLVYEIAKLHGGECEVLSEGADMGSEFVITIPDKN